MILRTEGDIVSASNAAQSLTNLVVAYLELYKKHAQGLNDVRIPTEPYTVIFRPMRTEGMLEVELIYTQTSTWSEPDYYDVDSDYFDESLGASNVSGYTTRSSSSIREYGLKIPFAVLLRSKEDMEKHLKDFVKRKKAEEEEKERKAEINRLKAKLAELENGAKS